MKKFLLLIVLCVMALPSFARSGEITEVPMQQTSGDDRTEFGPPVVALNRSQYVIASDVTAGKSIDSNRTQGDVTIPAGVEYEIEASGAVRLEDGFQVERGATFAVYPSSF